ncbi:ribonuclease III [Candidatus Nomurabacteria bacterium RIFCSPHIGHO2_02_FULL_38_15]|uniref:Ribonuclease 3 n=1 Tax=Candidatus Nomurabacteria bacterium RIFCSPHIGHO2_02_FULL_38_15 TaxID=1801752 RepID=A0A1F6VSR7_9BACT|nr:MAG: ribonuclease III [Candidatus Nomurabacteria bacterium RIFCSPHIGHO2_02_FULL_38_15]
MTTINFSIFEKQIGVNFKDKNLLTQAFTHRSYVNENAKLPHGHNERLEFLGDAVLELIVTDYLYDNYQSQNEGELTAYRSALVNAVIISDVAVEIGMNDFLLLSKGESKDIGKARTYILANTYEAFLGALYLDQGYDIARDFVLKTLVPKIVKIIKKKLYRDGKSLIQEKAQEVVGITPSYKVVSAIGPDHDKQFVIALYLGNELVAEGKGKSKQEAEQSAAREALEVKNWLD